MRSRFERVHGLERHLGEEGQIDAPYSCLCSCSRDARSSTAPGGSGHPAS